MMGRSQAGFPLVTMASTKLPIYLGSGKKLKQAVFEHIGGHLLRHFRDLSTVRPLSSARSSAG